jgi:hypothetical protein
LAANAKAGVHRGGWRMTLGHALQHVTEPGKGLDIVELGGGDC